MNPRKILGVDQNATQSEIQQAYRRQARKHHPDLGGDAWAFQQVQEAYQALTDTTPISTGEGRDTPDPQQQYSNRSAAGQTHGNHTSTNPTHKKNSESKWESDQNQHVPNSDDQRKWWQFFTGRLPLETETTTFILINCLDIFMTYLLLTRGAIEANPIANFFYQNCNFNGMIFFKLVTVAVVCVIAQVVAWKQPRTGKYLLILGSLLVGAVVIYSFGLMLTKVG